MKQLIHRATIINDGESYVGSILIDGERIAKIYRGEKIYRQAHGSTRANIGSPKVSSVRPTSSSLPRDSCSCLGA